MASQARVMLDTVCVHPASEVPEGRMTELAVATEFDTARFVRDLADAVGEPLRSGELGAGDAVELRRLLRGDEFLVGDDSGGGNSRGCWRVETMLIATLRQCGSWTVWNEGKRGGLLLL
jgi:hypothetical protein